MFYERLKKNQEFFHVYQNGEKWIGDYVIFVYLKNYLPHSRIGIVVSKKVGCAVVRNKIKRQIREIIRVNADLIPKGFDIVIISKVRAKDVKFQVLKEDVLKGFERLRKI